VKCPQDDQEAVERHAVEWRRQNEAPGLRPLGRRLAGGGAGGAGNRAGTPQAPPQPLQAPPEQQRLRQQQQQQQQEEEPRPINERQPLPPSTPRRQPSPPVRPPESVPLPLPSGDGDTRGGIDFPQPVAAAALGDDANSPMTEAPLPTRIEDEVEQVAFCERLLCSYGVLITLPRLQVQPAAAIMITGGTSGERQQASAPAI